MYASSGDEEEDDDDRRRVEEEWKELHAILLVVVLIVGRPAATTAIEGIQVRTVTVVRVVVVGSNCRKNRLEALCNNMLLL